MTPAFNEYGEPNKEIQDLAYELEILSRNFLNGMVNAGYSGTEIRAAGAYLSSVVDCSACEAILNLSYKIQKDMVKNADPNLNGEE